MAQRIQIDFVSDVVCPWCAIGLNGLEQALERLKGALEAEIRFQPFELNPAMPPEGQNLDQHIAEKYGRPPDAAMRATIRDRAAAVGFAINSGEESRIYNTFDAHRLLHWAGLEQAPEKQRQSALKHVLLKAYFTEGRNVADRAVLLAKAEEAGLDPEEARAILDSDRYAEEVRAEEQAWLAAGIHSVPAVVINRAYLISGGQPPEVFEANLREIANRA